MTGPVTGSTSAGSSSSAGGVSGATGPGSAPAGPNQPQVILPQGYVPVNVDWGTVTGHEIAVAADQAHVPNYLLAALYRYGYTGDPMQLALRLEYWFNAVGGQSWQRALAAYHAGTPAGAIDKTDLAWALTILQYGENLPKNLQGALDTGTLIALSIIIAGGFIATGFVAEGEAGAAVGAAGETTTEGGAGGVGLGTQFADIVGSTSYNVTGGVSAFEETTQGAAASAGYHYLRYATTVQVPLLHQQLDILAHRGIGG